MNEYKMKPGKIGEAVIDAYKKIEDGFVDTFMEKNENGEVTGGLKTGKVGDAVVGAYKKVENAVVGGYKKVENSFVDAFLEKEESVCEEKEPVEDK